MMDSVKHFKKKASSPAIPALLCIATAGALVIFGVFRISRHTPYEPNRSMTQNIESCKAHSGDQRRARCYDELFGSYLKTHEPLALLEEFKTAMDSDAFIRRDCHEIVHSIGRETFAKTKSVSAAFIAGEPLNICAGGYFHGVIEALFRPSQNVSAAEHIDISEIAQKIPSVCSSFKQSLDYSNCIHGIGHGVMYLSEDIESSVKLCEILPNSIDHFSCYSGVFMEYVISGHAKSDNRNDADFPCNTLGASYQDACYYVQSFRLVDMGLEKEELVAECQKASPELADMCIRGYGTFFLAHEALSEGPAPIADFCQSLDAAGAKTCVEAVASRLTAYSQDGKESIPFCALLNSSYLKKSCFSYMESVLRVVYKKSPADIAKDCRSYANTEEIGTCTDAALKR
jgi:hypothetical protein